MTSDIVSKKFMEFNPKRSITTKLKRNAATGDIFSTSLRTSGRNYDEPMQLRVEL